MNKIPTGANSESAEVYIKIAAAWQARGKFSHAISNYEKAIAQQPDYAPAYIELINLLIQMDRVERAIAVCHRAMEISDNYAWLPFLLDDFLIQQGKFRELEPPVEQMIDRYRSALAQKDSAEKFHILLYTNCPGIYGAEQANHALMCELAKSGYKVTCVQSKANHHLIDARSELGIEHVWLENNAHRFVYAVSNAPEVVEIFSKALPDLVIFADGDPVSNLAANRTATRLGIPFIRLIHCVMPERANQFSAYLSLLPDIYRAAKAVISVSQANLQLLHQMFGLPEHLGQVIYNGRPDQFFAERNNELRQQIRQGLGIPQEAIVCFTSARIDPVKGYQHQLNAIERLQKTALWSRLYFVWAGTGTLEEEIKAKATQIGAEEQIRFLGARQDIPDLLDAADLFLLPSHVEGMPLSIMEAMAKGLPVAATAISGVPEELGETGQLLPDPNLDPEATVQAIVRTIQAWAEDAGLRERIGEAGRKRAAVMFREEQMLKCYKNLIQQVIDSLP